MSLVQQPIGIIHTPYKQKFAIPRQPGLVNSALGIIQFLPEFNDPNILRGIDEFSHVWLIFQFHQTTEQGWSPLVRPPRLGGNKKTGVLATRSTFRPNNMGLSVVEFVKVVHQQGKLELHVRGMDLLDGTPILDVKPYVPYADALPNAKGGFAHSSPELMAVTFSPRALKQVQHFAQQYPKLTSLITEVLAQDPRPAYRADSEPNKVYGMSLYNLNIQWQVIDGCCQVADIQPHD
ncbi:tRNA (N6-threonylcarbamoyladenosine(37)-N6)-methyltransferase TrmO [Paraglaciecola hydrolytica]|uniref:tRNA-Thr(GGU) m(6)t(6)A37 methyltransferase TsaA n=1 Tax=Paraglaciecola hydrolytica TaxID=1799789 RepID=A0A135ZZY8_9ALTE|nr:tRNA (N6-threonylcarbamoyladenosine(37)-N6)-methyltransferase TrmO [Paraglaciecola hydrolytica]KXI28566.1 tRNA-Thr(GGU) m(6)t(6)A37 methyltransferase TsaA [Paraglaciecola hydrolytica]